MKRTRATSILLGLLALASIAPAQSPEDKAIAYLAGEVRQWPAKNGCFSCHNNGDGARALLIAGRLGKVIPQEALRETAAWLQRPGDWDSGAKNPAISDKVLAKIQFAAALSEMPAVNEAILLKAAADLLPSQKPDGSWPSDEGSIGSPATYGAALATWMALRTLESADKARFAASIARARAWLGKRKPASIPDAVASTLAGVADHRRLIEGWQNSDGGWGPWPKTPSEAFDTALALLAVNNKKGRAHLVATQQQQGGWPETTRPPGGQSYAQHISTTAWATIALLRTDPEGK